MRAIEVTAWGEKPVFTPSAKHAAEPTSSDEVQIRILATGLHHLVRSQAAGKHYSTNPASTPLPYIPGSDGVGTTPDGQLVYFANVGKGGAFADSITLPRSAITPIPNASLASTTKDNDTKPSTTGTSSKTEEQSDSTTKIATRIAALFNPAMSSWMALHTRVTPSILQQQNSFNILIVGATSLSGQLAIKHARHLGARTIIGLARDIRTMRTLDIDIPIQINADDITSTPIASVLSNASTRPDIILDYLYGPLAEHILSSLPGESDTMHDTGIEYIEIGSVMGPDIKIPGSVLRSKNITIRGAGYGSWTTRKDAVIWFPKLLERLCDESAFSLDQYPGIVQRRFEDVREAWDDHDRRTVFVN